MKHEEYLQYLQSDAWKRKAQKRLEIDGYACCICGSRGTATNPTEIHHITYRNIGREDIYKDLLTLCRACHKNVHRMMARVTGYNADGSERHGWYDDIPDYTVHVYSLSDGQTEIK